MYVSKHVHQHDIYANTNIWRHDYEYMYLDTQQPEKNMHICLYLRQAVHIRVKEGLPENIITPKTPKRRKEGKEGNKPR